MWVQPAPPLIPVARTADLNTCGKAPRRNVLQGASVQRFDLDRLDFLVDLDPRGANDTGFGHLGLEVRIVEE